MKNRSLVVPLLSLLGASACASDEDIGRASAELASVTWTNAVRVTAAGSDLSKTSAATGWNAGAVSVQTLAGDGFAEFTTAESNRGKMAGLSNGDTDQRYSDIDFAFYLKANGVVGIYEGGTLRSANVGTYAAGDVFRIETEAGVVTYWHNDLLVFTSSGTPSFPLALDASLRDPGATINGAVLQSIEFWQNVAGATATGNDLTNTAIDNHWASGASSIESLAGDGYAEFTTAEANTQKMAGLSNGDSDQGFADIDFAFYLKANGIISIYESGIRRSANVGTYAAGDVFRVAVEGTTVTYWRNGALVYTSLATPSFPLLLDSSLRSPGATIQDAAVVSAP